jgi:hypothetical protein
MSPHGADTPLPQVVPSPPPDVRDEPTPLDGPYGLSIAVRVIAAAWCVLLVVDWAAALGAAAVWQDAAARGQVWSQIEPTLYDSTGNLHLAAQAIAFVVGSLWLYRSRRLVDRLSPSYRHARTPAAVWPAWALPVVNLWFPYQIVRDIRRATIGPTASAGPVRMWWLMWLLWMVTDLVMAGVILTGTAEAVPRPELSTVLPWVVSGSAVLGIACGALWLRLVVEITAAQRTRIAPVQRPDMEMRPR